MRSLRPDAQIGLAVNLWPVHAASDSEEDQAAAARLGAYVNQWFLDPVYRGDYPTAMREAFAETLPTFTDEERRTVQRPLDFVGVNNYSRWLVRHDSERFLGAAQMGAPGPVTEMSWEIYPEALSEIICWVQEQYSPPAIYVTENGAAFEDKPDERGRVNDQDRVQYLHAYLSSAHRTLAEGAPLRGYFLWSLMDNFEWCFGFSKRFGIVRVEHDTQARMMKRSGYWYAQVIRANTLPSESSDT